MVGVGGTVDCILSAFLLSEKTNNFIIFFSKNSFRPNIFNQIYQPKAYYSNFSKVDFEKSRVRTVF